MLDELDALIEESVVFGELSVGVPARWLSSYADARMVAVLSGATQSVTRDIAHWTEAEEKYLRDNYRWMTDEEIGQALGRTGEAVHIHRERELKLMSRRDDPEWPNAREAARLLGIGCSKSIVRLAQEGVLPCHPKALKAHIWSVSRQALIRFAVNPENWIYFKPHCVTDPYLRRLIRLRAERWPDAWWTPGQVAAYHGVTVNNISKDIRAGQLPAKRWGNWWIKRSDAMQLRIEPGKGSGSSVEWTDAGDAFLVLAHALGFSHPSIAAMMKWPRSRVWYRLETLHERGAIPRLIQDYNLIVDYEPMTGKLSANWQDYQDKFPNVTDGAARKRMALCEVTA